MADEPKKKDHTKTFETLAFVGGGILLVWFVVSSSGGGSSTSAPTTSAAAPSDAAVSAAATEYGQQLAYQSSVLQAGSAATAAAIGAYTAHDTNATNIALGAQNTTLQESEAQLAANVANYSTEVQGETQQAEYTTAGKVAIVQSNNQTEALTQQYQDAAAVAIKQFDDQLGQTEAYVSGQTSVAASTAKVQTTQANDNFFSSILGDAALLFA